MKGACNMKNRVITISREFGSGGRTIGKKVAEALNIPCYDKELIHIDIPNKHFTLQTKSAIIRRWKMNYEVMPNIWGNKSSTNCARASSAC